MQLKNQKNALKLKTLNIKSFATSSKEELIRAQKGKLPVDPISSTIVVD